MIKPELILSLGAEEVSITLYGVKLEHDWNFILRFDQSGQVQREELIHDSLFKTGFHHAIELLDKYPWYMFIPRSIHPEFAEKILLEVEKRIPTEQFRLTYWRRLVARCLITKQIIKK
ncbi:MAG TPA: hypothetical protein VK190_03970 [Pseudoneobacillus sp.]|nr:hypothetical protein [Pseudoneobacillus sp.]